MGINFPDLQVLLPRADELARANTPEQQQDAQQLALAQAAAAQEERDRSRITRTRQAASSPRLRRERRDGKPSEGQRHPRKGRRIDVDA